MITPKVIYEVPIIEKQISLFKYFLNIDEKFRNNLYLEYPELKSQELNKGVISLYEKENNQLESQRETAQQNWNKIENDILKEFTNILQKDWNLNTVPGGISLLPFSTRDLREKRFDVYYKKDIKSILKTTSHELFHFIYFDKWKDIFPKTTIEDMDYPNPIWTLSEIVLPIMLNNSKVVDILNTKFNNYSMFEKEMFDGESVVEHIENIFRKNNLEESLKKGNEYINLYYRWRDRKKK